MNAAFPPALEAALASFIDPGRAPAMRAYMRDQFDYFGIGSPQRRMTVKPLLKTLADSGTLI